MFSFIHFELNTNFNFFSVKKQAKPKIKIQKNKMAKPCWIAGCDKSAPFWRINLIEIEGRVTGVAIEIQ